jgi:hypothetical protein
MKVLVHLTKKSTVRETSGGRVGAEGHAATVIPSIQERTRKVQGAGQQVGVADLQVVKEKGRGVVGEWCGHPAGLAGVVHKSFVSGRKNRHSNGWVWRRGWFWILAGMSTSEWKNSW